MSYEISIYFRLDAGQQGSTNQVPNFGGVRFPGFLQHSEHLHFVLFDQLQSTLEFGHDELGKQL